MDSYKNQFENDEIKVTYHPQLCVHSEKCARGLSDVFRTSLIPWIDLDAAKSKIIISQVKKCPSGALTYNLKKELAF